MKGSNAFFSLYLAVSLILQPIAALAIPTGGIVSGGSAVISNPNANTVQVNQSSQKAIINWQSFNIGRGQTAKFVHPNSSAITLNRINPEFGASKIFGDLVANGQVWLINPSGIIFGKSARVNVGGLVATTSDITDEDFMAGRYNFKKNPNYEGKIVNKGIIQAKPGGLVALVGSKVENHGIIQAKLGKVILGGAEAYTLDFDGDQLINFVVKKGATQADNSATVKNSGIIDVSAHAVALRNGAAKKIIADAINMSNVEVATSVTTEGGTIILHGGDGGVEVSNKVVATGGKVKIKGKTVEVAQADIQTSDTTKAGKIEIIGEDNLKITDSKISADGIGDNKGGEINLLGDNKILIENAVITANGNLGGGEILIGGDYQGLGDVQTAQYTIVDPLTLIEANALNSGDGGKVILWADSGTAFFGTINAKGGINSGDGGFVEVSGKENLIFAGNVSTLATNGKNGILLLDPRDISIVAASGQQYTGDILFDDNPNSDTQILASSLSNVMGDILLQANRDIFLNTSFTAHGNVTLQAGRTIRFVGDVGINVDPGNVNAVITLSANDPGADQSIRNTGGAFSGQIDMLSDNAFITGNDTTAINLLIHNNPNGGLMTILGDISGGNITIDTSNYNIVLDNGSVIAQGDINITGGQLQYYANAITSEVGTVNISANSIVRNTSLGDGVISGNTINLNVNGSIGSSATHILTTANTINVTGSGSIFLDNTGNVILQDISSGSNKTVNITATDTITLQGNQTINLSGSNLFSLSSQNLNIGSDVNITAVSGSINFTYDNINLDPTNTQFSAENISLSPFTNTLSIGVLTNDAVDWILTDDMLAHFTASNFRIGNGNNTGGIKIGAWTPHANLATNALTLQTQGSITQDGILNLHDASSLVLRNSSDINLNLVNNIRNLAGNNLSGVAALNTNGSLAIVNITDAAGSVTGLTTTGDFNIQTDGDITQTSRVIVGGLTTLSAFGNNIVLDNASNNFANLVLNNAADVTIRDTNSIAFGNGATQGGSSVISGILIITAGGIITQTDSLSGSSLVAKTLNNTAANTNINLNLQNDFDSINLQTRNAADSANVAGTITYTDVDGFNIEKISTTGNVSLVANDVITDSGRIDALTLNINSSAGAILDFGHGVDRFSLTNTNGDVEFVNTKNLELIGVSQTGGDLILTVTGELSQSGTAIIVSSDAILSATSNIIFGNSFNDFNNITIVSANDVLILETNSMTINASTIEGNLTLTANTDINIGGDVTVGGNASLTATDSIIASSSMFSTNNIVLRSDDIVLNGDMQIGGTALGAGFAGRVILETNSANRSMGIAGGAGDYALSAEEINKIRANNVRIGRSTTGNITFGTWTPDDTFAANTLTFQTNGSIAQSGSINLGNRDLIIRTSRNVALTNSDNVITNLAITPFGSNPGPLPIAITSSTGINIITAVDDLGTVNGIRTLTTQPLTLTANGTIQNGGGVLDLNSSVTLAVTALDSDIILNAANILRGTINITNNGNLRDLYIRSNHNTAPFTSSAINGLRNVTLEFNNLTNNGFINLPSMQISGDLNVSSNQSIGQLGVITVAGNTNLTAGSTINLANASNDFNVLSLTASRNVTIRDINSIVFGDWVVPGALNPQIHVTVGQSITQQENTSLTIPNFIWLTAGSDIILNSISNNINLILIDSAHDVTVNNSNTINLNGIDITGDLSVSVTQGNIIQSGFLAVLNGISTFKTPGNLNLSTSTNYLSKVILDEVGEANIKNDANFALSISGNVNSNLNIEAGNVTFDGALNADSLSISGRDISQDLQQGALNIAGATATEITATSINLGNVNNNFAAGFTLQVIEDALIANSDNLSVGESNVGGTFTIDNTGFDVSLDAPVQAASLIVNGENISQSQNGNLNISGVAQFTAADSVTLTNAGNQFGSLALDAINAIIAYADALTLGASNVTGTLDVTAGSLSQNGAITANAAEFDIAGAVNLNNGFENNITSLVLTQAASADINNGSNDINISGAVTNNLTLNVGQIVINNALSAGNLNMTGTTISQGAQAILDIDGAAQFTADTVTLTNAANQFGSLALDAINATIGYVGDLTLDATSITGTLDVTAGSLSQNGAITANAAEFDIAGAINLNSGFENNITSLVLTQADSVDINNGGNDINLSGAVTNNLNVSAGAIVIDNALSAGSLNMTGTTISQGAQAILDIDGAAQFTAADSITLTNAANQFGSLALDAINATIGYAGDLTLDATSITGTLDVTAGSLSQNGAITANAAEFDIAGAVNLNNGFENNIASLVLTQADSADINNGGNSINLSGAVTNNLNVSAGAIVIDNALSAGSLLLNGTNISQNQNAAISGAAEINADNVELTNTNNKFTNLTLNVTQDALIANSNNLSLGESIVGDILNIDNTGFNVSFDGPVQAASLTVNGADISQSQNGNFNISGVAQFTADSVVLTNAANQFGSLALEAINATIAYANALTLGASNITGTLDVTAGSLSQNGAITANAAEFDIAGAINLNSGFENNITLLVLTQADSVDINNGGNSINLSGIVNNTLNVAAGDIEVGNTLTVGSLEFTGNNISQQGQLNISDSAIINANSVNLDNVDNNFGSSLALQVSQDANIVTSNDLTLSQSHIGGALDLTANNIYQSSTITVNGLTTLKAQGEIQLLNANDFNTIDVAAQNASINDVDNINLNSVNVGADLNVSAGSITQTNIGIEVAGNAVFSINSPNGDILLDDASNNFVSDVTFTDNGNIRDLAFRNINENAQVSALPNTLRNLTLIFDQAAIVLPGVNVSNNIVLQSGGSISQTGSVQANSFSSTSAGGVNLGDFENQIAIFSAENVGGDILLQNNYDAGSGLVINGISNLESINNQVGAGNVDITNTGSILVTGDGITTEGGNVSLTTLSSDEFVRSIVIDSPIVTQGGTFTANADNPNQMDASIIVNALIDTTGGGSQGTLFVGSGVELNVQPNVGASIGLFGNGFVPPVPPAPPTPSVAPNETVMLDNFAVIINGIIQYTHQGSALFDSRITESQIGSDLGRVMYVNVTNGVIELSYNKSPVLSNNRGFTSYLNYLNAGLFSSYNDALVSSGVTGFEFASQSELRNALLKFGPGKFWMSDNTKFNYYQNLSSDDSANVSNQHQFPMFLLTMFILFMGAFIISLLRNRRS